MRNALKTNKGEMCYFVATTDKLCYNYRMLRGVEIYDNFQSKGGERRKIGYTDHVLVGQKGLDKRSLNKSGLKICGTGVIYKYTRSDGTKDFSFKVNNAHLA